MLEVSHRKEVGDHYAAHQLMIGNFRLALTLTARDRGIGFTWRAVLDDAPVRPDGFFALQFPNRPERKNRAHFFLEADRPTMTRERFVKKLEGYWAWHEQGGHTAALGIKTFRVQTVTKSEERLRSLLAATAGAPQLQNGMAHFWFTPESRFTPVGLQSIFRRNLGND